MTVPAALSSQTRLLQTVPRDDDVFARLDGVKHSIAVTFCNREELRSRTSNHPTR